MSGSETLRMMQAQAKDFLEEKTELESSSLPPIFESVQQSAPDIPASENDSAELQEQRQEENDAAASVAEANSSINEGNVLQESNRLLESSTEVPIPTSSSSTSLESYKCGKEGETSLIEQFEHGVYITAIVLPSGTKVFKRVRFSKRKFDGHQAEEWWNRNKDRVYKKYSPAGTKDAAGTGSSVTLPHSEDNVEASPSKM
ncbi:putative brevis radix (BRX) domain-containing protein [Lupinus albus]|uniref:Putative brevis radix (BRX) domain-containing protein n=1 Tax=Lupinus albus TaxID=3870 RepID=A0A6A4R8U8_LUPAL|nr:putative brevis radix (BRX) domain-containing protein [Lupinus albus]